MAIFHNYILTWWQIGMLKLALLALGIILGSTWPIFFKKSIVWWVLLSILILFVIYLVIAVWPQF